jgi:para-nitrobenzyl esterase
MKRQQKTRATWLGAVAAAIAAGLTVSSAQAVATHQATAAGTQPQQAAPAGTSYPGRYPVVSTDKGLVKGEAKSMVISFKGIPYAAPPVGNRRWKAPQPAKAWQGVRDATQFGDSCVQGTGWDPGYEEPTLTENCLYINVYRPTNSTKKKLPVFVWNHGGGNFAGAGRDTNPDKFVTRSNQVFVTFNYRLGSMGYLTTPALQSANKDGSAGNFGILDQQAALRWVQKNIRSFGGDPKNVTLAGQSAGAGNTCAQLASPGAKGLFHHAILQSGGCSARAPEAANASGTRFAAALGCTDAATQVACLRSKTPEQILAAPRQSGSVYGNDVLPSDPLALLKAGTLTKLPVIVGGTSDERQQSVFGAYDYLGNPITESMLAGLISDTYGEDAARVTAAYPVADQWSPTVAWGKITSDERACTDQAVRDRMASTTKTWAYEFAEKNGPAFTSIWRLGTDYPFGATHVNDLGYLWDYLGTALPFSTDQVDLSNQMISYWSSFAETGRPAAPYAPSWPRYQPQGKQLQLVAPSARVVSQAEIADEHNCALWDEVSPAP